MLNGILKVIGTIIVTAAGAVIAGLILHWLTHEPQKPEAPKKPSVSTQKETLSTKAPSIPDYKKDSSLYISNKKNNDQKRINYKGLDISIANANQLGKKGIALKKQGKLSEALEYFQQALIIHKEVGDLRGQAADHGNIGQILNKKDMLYEAQEHLFEALRVSRELNDIHGQATALGDIGIIFSKQGNFPEALKHANNALNIHEKIDDLSGQAAAHGNIGKIYRMQGKKTEALEHFQEARDIYLRIGASVGAKKAIEDIERTKSMY